MAFGSWAVHISWSNVVCLSEIL